MTEREIADWEREIRHRHKRRLSAAYIADWEREIRHAQKMQEQRKSKSAEMQINVYELEDNDNEINNQ